MPTGNGIQVKGVYGMRAQVTAKKTASFFCTISLVHACDMKEEYKAKC